MKKIISVLLVCMIIPLFAVSVSAEFITKDGKTYYVQDDGTYAKGLTKINGSYYYFDKNGKMSKNCKVKVGNYIYRFDKDGKLVEKIDGLVKLGKYYYYCEKGKVQINRFLEFEDGYRYFDKYGHMSISETKKNVDDLLIISTNSDGIIYEIFSIIGVGTNIKKDGITIDSILFYTDGNKVYVTGNYRVVSADVRYVSISVKLLDSEGYVVEDEWLISVDDNLSYGDKVRIKDSRTCSDVSSVEFGKFRIHK